MKVQSTVKPQGKSQSASKPILSSAHPSFMASPPEQPVEKQPTSRIVPEEKSSDHKEIVPEWMIQHQKDIQAGRNILGEEQKMVLDRVLAGESVRTIPLLELPPLPCLRRTHLYRPADLALLHWVSRNRQDVSSPSDYRRTIASR